MERLGSVFARVRDQVKGIRRPQIGKQDALAAVTTGVANVPDGMASAVLAGVNPVFGIYTLIIGTPIAALSNSTKLMMFNTTSAMTLVAVDGLGSRQGDDRAEALFAIALVAGLFQLALGLLGLGLLTKFVSNSVMVGFLTGISALVIMGQLWDLTGYEGEGGSKLEKTAQLLANLRDVDPATTVFGIGSLVLMVLLGRSRLSSYSLLIALVVGLVAAWIGGFDTVILVSSLGEIPRSLPSLDLPSFGLIPKMLLAGIAVGAVGLLQAACVAQAFPNPDGTDTDDSRDFAGQGVANIASSCFQGMAGGGSLSGTALNVSAGARSRWAAVMQAIVVMVLVLLFGGLLGRIPMAGLAALLIYSASLSIKFPAIVMVSRTSWTSIAGMLVTFLATLVMPLQQAVMVGIALASILFLYRASTDVRVQRIQVDNGRLTVSDPPAELPSNAVTVIDVEGNLFYAGSRTLSKLLPDPKGTSHAGVVLRLRSQTEIGSTFFKVIGKYAGDLRTHGGVLLLAGVNPAVKDRMQRAGQLDLIGTDRIFLADSVIGESTTEALRAGEAWLAALTAEPPSVDEIVVPAATDGSAEPETAEESAVPDATEPEVAKPAPLVTIRATLTDLVHQYAPKRSDLSVRALFLAGVAAVAIGLAAVLFPDAMLQLLMPLVGGLFIAVAAFWTLRTVTASSASWQRDDQFRMLSAGIALMTGVSLIAQPFTKYISLDTALVLLAIGLALLGALGLVADYRGDSDSETRVASLTADFVLIGLALLTLLVVNEKSPIKILGWLTLAAGVCLIAYAYIVSRRSSRVEQIPDSA